MTRRGLLTSLLLSPLGLAVVGVAGAKGKDRPGIPEKRPPVTVHTLKKEVDLLRRRVEALEGK
jgi:hypothetical protein